MQISVNKNPVCSSKQKSQSSTLLNLKQELSSLRAEKKQFLEKYKHRLKQRKQPKPKTFRHKSVGTSSNRYNHFSSSDIPNPPDFNDNKPKGIIKDFAKLAEIYGGPTMIWLLLKERILGSAEYVQLLENYDICFDREDHDSLPVRVSQSTNQSQIRPSNVTLSSENLSLASKSIHIPQSHINLALNNFEFGQRLSKSNRKSSEYSTSLQVPMVTLRKSDPNLSRSETIKKLKRKTTFLREGNLSLNLDKPKHQTVKIDFLRKRNKKWKTLVNKRLKEYMDTRLSLNVNQKNMGNIKFPIKRRRTEYCLDEIQTWRETVNFKKIIKEISSLTKKGLLKKLFFISDTKDSIGILEIEKNQKAIEEKFGDKLFIPRAEFFKFALKGKDLKLNQTFYKSLKVLVFTNFPNKISRVIKNDLIRVRKSN